MKMHFAWYVRISTFALLLASAAALGCGNKAETKPDAAPPSASAATTASATPVARKPGEMPFDFASTATAAKAGDYVLVPSPNWIDEAFVKGGEKQTFIYYAATMIEPGPLDSKVKSLSGQTFTAPNGFIIALKSAQKAKPGDVVLTWWQSGSGLQRSIVTGGSAESPTALHLDMDLDNPAKIAQKEDVLKPNTFHKLGTALEPGITLACKDGSKYAKWIAASVNGDKILGLGFGGSMKVFPKAQCTVVSPQGVWSPSKDVAVPYMSTFQKAKVDKVDAKAGRVFAKFNWGNKDQNVGVGIQDVSPLLPGM